MNRLPTADKANGETEGRDFAETPRDIIGWMVGSHDSNPAMYNLAQRTEAFAAAVRWNRPISALVLHPSVPEPTP